MIRATTTLFAAAIFLALSGTALGQATINPAARSPAAGPVMRTGPKPTANPGWWNDAVFYEIFVRSFSDSRTGPKANDGIGDIQGLIDRLDYLNDGDPATTTDLGVTGLWLMPITQSPSYHGYDTTDYRTVESDYGSNEDFKRLMLECHKRGIKVIIDLVLNHCSSQHPWFLEAQDPASPKHDWFVWEKQDPNFKGPWNQKVWHQVKGKPELGYYYGLFNNDMPDMNFANTALSDEMLSTCEFWLKDMNIDGFRLDAIRHLFEDGQLTDSLPATHEWLRTFAARLSAVKPEAFTVGEVWAPTAVSSAYVNELSKRELDTTFEFDLAPAILDAANTGEAAKLAKQMQTTWDGFPDNQFATFLTNHDQARVMTILKGDISKAKLAASLLLTLPGVPFLYYGEEIGMVGDKPDPEIRTPMQWTAATRPAAKPSTPSPADPAQPEADPATTDSVKAAPAGLLNQTFSAVKPWKPINANASRVNVERQSTDPTSLLSQYKRMIRLRQNTPALRRGGIVMASSTHPSVLAFVRTPAAPAAPSAARTAASAQQPILVIANLSGEPVQKYTLTIRDAKLPVGPLIATELLTDVKTNELKPLAGLSVASNGDLVSVIPIPVLRPRTVYVLRLGQ